MEIRLAHGHILGNYGGLTSVMREGQAWVGGKIPRFGALISLKVEEVSLALSMQSFLSLLGCGCYVSFKFLLPSLP